jgi:NAD(P)-dependent dehydrogenase (short-subunit alcohol dehydrogenase family)
MDGSADDAAGGGGSGGDGGSGADGGGPAGDVALVTGAASGIGRAVVRRFHAAGWRVHATDVDEEGLASLPSAVRTHRLDVTEAGAATRVVDAVRAADGRVDCLLNVAGVGTLAPVEDVSGDRARRTFEVNVLGTLRVTRAVLPAMRERRAGRVVTVTSVTGRTVPPGMGVYAASKHAVEALTDALRREAGPLGVDVVAVQPAWVHTSFAERARAAAPGDDGGVPDEEGARRGGDGRTADYAPVYALDDRLDFLGGGPLSVPPDRVARTVHRAATAEAPRARYPVGHVARAVLASRWLPTPVVDAGFRLLSRLARALP